MLPSRRALVWGVPLLVWAVLPFMATRHIVDLLVFAGLYTIAGLGVAFLLGQCGIVSLAQSVLSRSLVDALDGPHLGLETIDAVGGTEETLFPPTGAPTVLHDPIITTIFIATISNDQHRMIQGL